MGKKTYDVSENAKKDHEVADVGKPSPDEKEPKVLFGTAGTKCYWLILGVVGLACIALVVVLAVLGSWTIEDKKEANQNFTSASSKGWTFSGRLVAYPRLPDNSPDTTDIKYCDTPLDEILNSTDRFFQEYDGLAGNDYQDCSGGRNPTDKRPCFFDINSIMSPGCSRNTLYGLKNVDMSPCYFLRIEEGEDWAPNNDGDSKAKDNIEVTCKAKKRKEKLRTGTIRVEPKTGFSSHFFPQSIYNSRVYRPPVVLVQFMNPEAGKDITAHCQVVVTNGNKLRFQGNVNLKFRLPDTSVNCIKTYINLVVSAVQPTSSTANPVEEKNADPITTDTPRTTLQSSISTEKSTTLDVPSNSSQALSTNDNAITNGTTPTTLNFQNTTIQLASNATTNGTNSTSTANGPTPKIIPSANITKATAASVADVDQSSLPPLNNTLQNSTFGNPANLTV